MQQDLSRKTKGSNNRKKAVVKVARAHAQVADTRRDWQHKLSTAIIRDNQAVFVEDLCVVGLGRTRLAKSVHDAGWASFTAMLEYKAARYGRTFARVDRFFPSTRRCSDCGRINDKMALDVRAWDCPCGSTHDRDVNAAMNVLAAGRAESLNACGAQVRPAPVPAPRREAGIRPDAACSTRSAEGTSVLQGGEIVNAVTRWSHLLRRLRPGGVPGADRVHGGRQGLRQRARPPRRRRRRPGRRHRGAHRLPGGARRRRQGAADPAKGPALLYDLVAAAQNHIPNSGFIVAFGILLIGMIAGLEGSGFSGLPLTGSLAGSLGPAAGISSETLAAVGQMGNICSGGGTLVAWSSLIAVAGFARVPVIDLARRCFIPVVSGLVVGDHLRRGLLPVGLGNGTCGGGGTCSPPAHVPSPAWR
ncbi:transposase [Micromonospora sp. 4G55]|nr:transposase [Micromonospora sp. 4G55]